MKRILRVCETVSFRNWRRQKKQLQSCNRGWRMPKQSLTWSPRAKGSVHLIYVHVVIVLPSVLWCCWLGGRKGIWPVKNSGGVLAWLSVWTEVQTCMWPSWCHCHSLSFAPVKSRLVLPFWYRLTQVVLEKRPLNGCSCSNAQCSFVTTHSTAGTHLKASGKLWLTPPPLLILLHPFIGLRSRTTCVSWYKKGKTSLDLNEARDDGVWECSGISWTMCKQSAPRSR